MNLFERAARGKYTYPSKRGDLSTEQLFDLQLTNANGFNLDEVAKALDAELEAAGTKSFVTPSQNDERRSELEAKLEIVKHVIAGKIAARDAAVTAAQNATKKKRILEVLAKKQESALEGKSEAELLAELEAIGA